MCYSVSELELFLNKISICIDVPLVDFTLQYYHIGFENKKFIAIILFVKRPPKTFQHAAQELRMKFIQ